MAEKVVDVGQPRLHAYVWWCGDEVCDCYQPVIELLVPNPLLPWSNANLAERVWEGEFISGGTDGRDLDAELATECEARGIPVGMSVTGKYYDLAREVATKHVEYNRRFKQEPQGTTKENP